MSDIFSGQQAPDTTGAPSRSRPVAATNGNGESQEEGRAVVTAEERKRKAEEELQNAAKRVAPSPNSSNNNIASFNGTSSSNTMPSFNSSSSNNMYARLPPAAFSVLRPKREEEVLWTRILGFLTSPTDPMRPKLTMPYAMCIICGDELDISGIKPTKPDVVRVPGVVLVLCDHMFCKQCYFRHELYSAAKYRRFSCPVCKCGKDKFRERGRCRCGFPVKPLPTSRVVAGPRGDVSSWAEAGVEFPCRRHTGNEEEDAEDDDEEDEEED
ncbi:hypothetical protein B0H63DRAFT_446087 [Podospora didyma]|uniref:RING-type domain-containing protein n=1 Tax=Podospora didyma TaxID=330526 RepID=A0AAE0NYK1_9PEZI|nr:hypothetical protein B0H63DRAFT_446087 [Podospora didyma]